jgi:pilus assembly protein TadC
MRIPDLLLVAAPLLPALLLLSLSLDRAIRRYPGRGPKADLARLHGRLQEALTERNVFPFPGVRMVRSVRPWYAAEAAFLAFLVLSVSSRPGWTHLAFSLPLASVFGGLVLFFCLREEARRRMAEVRASLPVASFMLSLLLDAGIGSHVALQETASALPPGPLADELSELSRARMLGVPRDEALDRSRRRVTLDDYHVFLNLVQQGEQLGVGLSRALGEHSRNMLEKRRQRAETLAQKAAVKILFPLVVFIFPAVFLVILSPVLLDLWEMWTR